MLTYIYIPGDRVIDVRDEEDPAYPCRTIEEIQEEYPGAIVGSEEDVANSFCTSPAEITRERWGEMFCDGLPVGFKGWNGTESFRLCEYVILDVQRILCRIGSEFFEFYDRSSITHEQIVEKVTAFITERDTNKLSTLLGQKATMLIQNTMGFTILRHVTVHGETALCEGGISLHYTMKRHRKPKGYRISAQETKLAIALGWQMVEGMTVEQYSCYIYKDATCFGEDDWDNAFTQLKDVKYLHGATL
jgi:hypothetical protein